MRNKLSIKNVCREKMIRAAYNAFAPQQTSVLQSLQITQTRGICKESCHHCSKQIICNHYLQLFIGEVKVLQQSLTNYSLE